jgi:hypothetical protein
MLDPIQFVAEHGIALKSGRGPFPNLAEAVAGAKIPGSWWKHAKARTIFRATRVVRDCEDILVCRSIDGKITFIHRRLWPAVVRLARRFESDHLAAIREEHTATGAHRVNTVPFPRWVPAEVSAAASVLSDVEAEQQLGEWAQPPRKVVRKDKPRKSR